MDAFSSPSHATIIAVATILLAAFGLYSGTGPVELLLIAFLTLLLGACLYLAATVLVLAAKRLGIRGVETG